MQITLNPAEELPNTLRAVALLLNSIASDRDGGKQVPENAAHAAIFRELNATPPAAQGGNDQTPPPPPPVVGASDNSTPPPAADANSDATTYSANDLDANGLPWIEAIHSSSKNRNADNTWRYLRGGDPAERARVEAEVRAKMAAGVTGDAPPPPPIVDAPAADQTPPPPPPLTEAPADTATTQPATGTVFSMLSKMSAEDRLTALETVSLKSPAEFLKEVKVRPEVATELLNAINMIQGDE